jgi:hypothetical protein
MKRTALFLVIALSLARAASAANGTVGASTSDAVTATISGASWQNAHWEVRTAGTSKLTTEYTNDGVNWLPAPYSQRVDAVTANPSVASWQNTTAVAGAYDTPLPGNAVAFRVRCGTTGTSTVLTVVSGKTYVPGNPVVAILYDVTSAVNTLNDTGVIDTSGWAGLSMAFTTPAGGSGTVKPIDDTGTAVVANAITVPASAGVLLVLSPSAPNVSATGTSGVVSGAWRFRRTQATNAAVAALTSRIRVEAWR